MRIHFVAGGSAVFVIGECMRGLYVTISETIFFPAYSTATHVSLHHLLLFSVIFLSCNARKERKKRSLHVTTTYFFFLLAPNALPLCGSNIKHNNLRIRWSIYTETSSFFHAKCFNIFNQFLWLLFHRCELRKFCCEKALILLFD